ncbi:MAG: hypoxanthine phosphoribosyltransferase [Bacteroidia bacterium]|nr:hypoxanthine phosphoribosyltransferase [Bacteroidia bacterium]
MVTLKDKQFKPYIKSEQIEAAVKKVAQQINADLKNEMPLFVAVLNGSFMFAADLMKQIEIPCEISFVKMASYHGTESTGKVNELIGLNQNIEGRTVVVIEDIVDTGNTIEKLTSMLKDKKVKSFKIATALFKPSVYKKDIKIDYVGIEIPNDFVVGYGLDYDGLGRNLKDILVIA